MANRVAVLARGLLAFACASALAVGLPVLLVAVIGNPLPAELPTLDEIRVTLTQSGDGFAQFVIALLTGLVWLLWVQFIVGLVWEIAAVGRRRDSGLLPFNMGMHRLARHLVATILLAATLAAHPIAPSIGALTLDVATADAIPTGHAADVVESDHGAPPSLVVDVQEAALERDSTDREPAAVVVADATELWDLAASALGDGAAWRTIAEANDGRVDAHGSAMTVRTEAVPAGTVLVMPASADVAPLMASGLVRTAEGTQGRVQALETDDATVGESSGFHEVTRGESMWSIAEDRVTEEFGANSGAAEVGPYWERLVAENRDVPSGDVDLIYPGDRLRLPTALADQGDESPRRMLRPDLVDDPPGIVESGQSGVAADESDRARAVASDASLEAPEAQVSVTERSTGSSSMTARDIVDPAAPADVPSRVSNVIGEVPDQVHRSEVTSQAGSDLVDRADAPADDASESDAEVTSSAVGMAGLGAVLLASALIAMIRRRRSRQRRFRRPGTLAPTPTREAAVFELALAHAATTLVEADDGSWTAIPDASLHALRTTAVSGGEVPDDSSAPADAKAALAASEPLSLLVGTDRKSLDAVYISLRRSDRLGLDGDASAVREAARLFAIDLASTSRLDDVLVVMVTGEAANGAMSDLDRVEVSAGWDRAIEVVRQSPHSAPDSTTPIVVIGETAPDPECLARLDELCVILIAPALTADRHLKLSPPLAELVPMGCEVELPALPDGGVDRLSELIASTAIDATVPEQTADSSLLSRPATRPDRGPAPGRIDIRILGPVEVAGADSFSSIKAVDVVTYMAFHRHGVDTDQLKTWIWPMFEPPTDKALANVMSRARTGLGRGSDGEPLLSRAGPDKMFRLSEEVTTDFDRFKALIANADDREDRSDRLDGYRDALELIRGVPFSGGAATSFAWADNHVRPMVEYAVDEAVHRCADLGLELGELTIARWATLKGLELVPGCEACFRRRFLVAGADRNRTELHRAMAELERVASDGLGEPEAIDTISDDLLQLFAATDRSLLDGVA